MCISITCLCFPPLCQTSDISSTSFNVRAALSVPSVLGITFLFTHQLRQRPMSRIKISFHLHFSLSQNSSLSYHLDRPYCRQRSAQTCPPYYTKIICDEYPLSSKCGHQVPPTPAHDRYIRSQMLHCQTPGFVWVKKAKIRQDPRESRFAEGRGFAQRSPCSAFLYSNQFGLSSRSRLDESPLCRRHLLLHSRCP